MVRLLHFSLTLLIGLVAARPTAAEPSPDPRSTGTPFLRLWRAEDYRASPVNWRVLPHPATGLVYVSNHFGVLEFDDATVHLIPLPRAGAAVVEIANTGRWLPPAAGRSTESTGIGLENVVARLDRSFPPATGSKSSPATAG